MSLREYAAVAFWGRPCRTLAGQRSQSSPAVTSDQCSSSLPSFKEWFWEGRILPGVGNIGRVGRGQSSGWARDDNCECESNKIGGQSLFAHRAVRMVCSRLKVTLPGPLTIFIHNLLLCLLHLHLLFHLVEGADISLEAICGNKLVRVKPPSLLLDQPSM